MRASQGWWVPMLSVAQLVLSVGLLVGGGLVLLCRQGWRAVLAPTLLVGVAVELLLGLTELASTWVNRQMMFDVFGAAMAADPNLPPEFGQIAGQAVGALMLVAMLFMLAWAVLKSALYLWARSVVAGPRGEAWFGVAND